MLFFHLTGRKYSLETRRTLTHFAALFTDLIQWVWNKVGAPDVNVEEENVNLWCLVASNFGYQWTPCCEDHLLLWILQQNSVLLTLYLMQRLFDIVWDGRIVICSEAEMMKWLWHILRNSAKTTETLCQDVWCPSWPECHIISSAKQLHCHLSKCVQCDFCIAEECQSLWLHSMRHGSVSTRLLGLWVWYVSLVSVVCCQAEVSAMEWSLSKWHTTLPSVVCLSVIWNLNNKETYGH